MMAATPTKPESEAEAGGSKDQHALILAFYSKIAGITRSARTGKAVNPPALISDEKIVMTEWELQDLAVQVVRDQLVKEGRELMSWNGDPRVNPSLWFAGDAGPEWVVVRAVRYPEAEAKLPENIVEMQSHFNKLGYPGHFAPIAVASVDDPFDPDVATNCNVVPLYRGHAMHIQFEELKKI